MGAAAALAGKCGGMSEAPMRATDTMVFQLTACRLALGVALLAGCGAKSPLIVPDVGNVVDAATPSPDGCVPAPEVCNGRDDDCNGLVDDVDRGHDGITDCLNIVVLGNPGTNPSSDFDSWLRSNGARVDRLLTTTAPRLTPELLAPYNIAIIDWLTREYDASEAAALRAWIEAGGGLVSLTGHFFARTSSVDRPGSLLSVFGVGYVDGILDGPVRDFTPHPTTTGLTALPFVGGFRVAVLSPGDAGPGTSVVVARLPEGAVGVAHEQGAGRVFVWGDEWVEFDSEWRTMPTVNRFWVNVLGWLSHQR